MTYDAIVLGGGPAGASTALTLARAGWSVAVVEKSPFPRRKVCGDFMSATNLPLIERFGVGETWRRHAGPEVRRVGLFFEQTTLSAAMPRSASGDFGRALGRERLDASLLEAAREAGARIVQPWRASRLMSGLGMHTVQVVSRAGEQALRARVVVAAHGSWEPGTLPPQPVKARGPADLLGFKAYFRKAQLPAELMPLLAFPGGYGGLVHADDGRLSLSCCIRRDVLASAREAAGGVSAGEAVRQHIERHCRGVRDALAGAFPDGGWLGAGPIRPGIRPRYRDDVFRVGNAAGEAHPVVAEGISMALQSGWLLASELAGIDPCDPAARAAAGRRYAASWRAQFWGRIAAAGLFARLAMLPLSAAVAGPVVRMAPGLLTLGAALAGKAKPLPLNQVDGESPVSARSAARFSAAGAARRAAANAATLPVCRGGAGSRRDPRPGPPAEPP